MSALTVRRKKFAKPGEKVAQKIETCDVSNCTKSGQYEAFWLDHEYAKWFLCEQHQLEALKTYDEVRFQ